MNSFQRARKAVLIGLALILCAAGATAQQLVLKGEYGLMGGTMAPPGFYAGVLGSFTWADELKTPDGKSLSGPELSQYLFAPLLIWVSDFQILGGDYGQCPSPTS